MLPFPFSPLHTIKSGSTWVGGWGIMTPYSIQETIDYPDCYPTPPPGHRGTRGPLVGVGIITFHRTQARGAITPTHCIQPAKGRYRKLIIMKLSMTIIINHHCSERQVPYFNGSANVTRIQLAKQDGYVQFVCQIHCFPHLKLYYYYILYILEDFPLGQRFLIFSNLSTPLVRCRQSSTP